MRHLSVRSFGFTSRCFGDHDGAATARPTRPRRAPIRCARDSIARARQDSINRALPGYVVDSILPIDEEIRRFAARIGGDPVTSFAHASASREALVRRIVRDVTRATAPISRPRRSRRANSSTSCIRARRTRIRPIASRRTSSGCRSPTRAPAAIADLLRAARWPGVRIRDARVRREARASGIEHALRGLYRHGERPIASRGQAALVRIDRRARRAIQDSELSKSVLSPTRPGTTTGRSSPLVHSAVSPE